MNTVYTIIPTTDFLTDLKKLSKLHKSIIKDIDATAQELKSNPFVGTSLGKDCYKVRVRIQSLGKGKRSGARLITCVKVVKSTVYLIALYDKNMWDAIPDAELKARLKQIPSS